MKLHLTLPAVAILTAASLFSAKAQPYFVAGSALTPSWAPGDPGNQMTGGPTVYSLTTGTAANAVHEWKVTGTTWGDPNWPSDNVQCKGDANGTNTFYFLPGSATDGWLPLENRVGYADPGNMSWEVIGDFTSWNSIPNAQMQSLGNGLYKLEFVVTNAGSHEFKFRDPGSWDYSIGATFSKSAANASVITTQAMQNVLFQLDVPNGRWLAGAPVVPVTNQVVFAVDMSVEILRGAFDPASDSVFVSGAFNNWPGTATGALVLTNYPTYLGGDNTNIYYGTNTFTGPPLGPGSDYKFTDNNPAVAGSGGYEPISGNRTFVLLATNGVELLPVVNFGNTTASDYLPVDTMVTFTVNMTNAYTAAGLNPPIDPPVAFDPSLGQTLYINGDFLNGGWISTWNPLSLSGTIMTETSPGSWIYTFSYLVPKGNRVEVHYKYGFDDGAHALDNEAPAYQDHVRFIRSTASGSYAMPTDTFGVQLVEPSFGQLTVNPGPAGKVSLQWLGRPGVTVQTTSDLAGGAWMNHPETDGTNWTSGIMSTNGFVSTTNWPTSDASGFFRLLKQ